MANPKNFPAEMLSQYAESIIEILYLPLKDPTNENCLELMGFLSKVDFFGKIFQDKNFGKMSHKSPGRKGPENHPGFWGNAAV
jgi:hypothetical protein